MPVRGKAWVEALLIVPVFSTNLVGPKKKPAETRAATSGDPRDPRPRPSKPSAEADEAKPAEGSASSTQPEECPEEKKPEDEEEADFGEAPESEQVPAPITLNPNPKP